MRLGNVIDMTGVHLRRNGKEILRNIDWHMKQGEHWAVIGANGSGKTTLLQIAGGILFPTVGETTVLDCRFGASDLFLLRRRIGWVSSALQARMPTLETVRDIVISGLKATFGLVYEYTDHDAGLADSAIERVGLSDRGAAPFGVLSQGEQQKTLFARAMMATPELYILDEPCCGLDLAARESFLGVVEDVVRNGRAGVVMVTHHIEEIPPGLTHALVLKEGAVLAAGPVDETVTSENLSAAFTIPVVVERWNDRFRATVR